MNNKIIAVAVVLVAIVATATIAIGMAGSDDDAVEPTGRLVIYGNANNDDYLNADDVSFIQAIVDGGAEWDRQENPYADTNVDGVIDSDDIELLNKFINREEALMYYTDFFGETSYVHFPITGSIGTQSIYTAQICVALGVWDRVTACNKSSTMSVGYPGLDDRLDIGSWRNMSAETVIDSGVSVLLAHDECQELKEQIENSGTGIDVIPLSTQGGNTPITMVTLGVMLGCEEGAQWYLDYVDEVTTYLEDSLSSVQEEDYVTFYFLYQPSDTGSISVYDYSSHVARCFDYLPCAVNYLNMQNGFDRTTYGMETIIQDCPDYIIMGTADMNTWTREAALEGYANGVEMFRMTQAYEDGHIIGVSYNVFNIVNFVGDLVLIASHLYPDLVDVEYGWDMLQKWYDDFTYMDVDVRNMGGAVYSVGDLERFF